MTSTGPGRGLRHLRELAIRTSLFTPTSLAGAVDALDFVQYDPIRNPACAQDLILHQRVRGYRAGDLGRAYPHLPLEEGYLHVYGAMTRRLAVEAGPRGRFAGDGYQPSGLAADVLTLLGEGGEAHVREIAVRLDAGTVTNAWGGTSSATTRALDELHRHWLVRVARRDQGVKVYALAPALPPDAPAPVERARRLVLHVAKSLMPVPLPSLRGVLTELRRRGGTATATHVDGLLRSGELTLVRADGLDYVWPTDAPAPSGTLGRGVRFLAPFDPVVWDRRRFEHLWGWPYRFEAYTPAAKRRYGPYTMPMIAGDHAVGLIQCATSAEHLSVTVHRVGGRREGKHFRAAFDRELTRLAAMVGKRPGSVDLGAGWP